MKKLSKIPDHYNFKVQKKVLYIEILKKHPDIMAIDLYSEILNEVDQRTYVGIVAASRISYPLEKQEARKVIEILFGLRNLKFFTLIRHKMPDPKDIDSYTVAKEFLGQKGIDYCTFYDEDEAWDWVNAKLEAIEAEE